MGETESKEENTDLNDMFHSHPDKLENQECPFCTTKNLTLMEELIDIPYFGKTYVFSMHCSNCKYKKADVELAEQHEPCKYSFEINSEEDLNVRVVKNSEAIIKIPRMITIESGPASNGYVTNIEGILNRVKKALETMKDSEEDPNAKKKVKKMLKKLNRATWGKEKLKIIIEDPNGNSAIISDKAIKGKL